jgi:hypothetical protein
MARGHEPEEFIGPREVSEERERKAPQPSRNDESRDQVREELAQGAGSQPIPAPLAHLRFARSTKSGAGPIVCGPPKSQRWSKSASFARLLRRT